MSSSRPTLRQRRVRLLPGQSLLRAAQVIAAALLCTLSSSATAQISPLPLNPKLAAAAFDSAIDTGPLPAAAPIQLTVTLSIPPDRTAALDTFLAALASPSSPSYHHWITPAQFADQFGATDTQIAAATSWLAAQGFTVAAISPARTRLQVTGSSAQVASAFSASLHRYTLAANSYFANTSPATVPSLVLSISGLDNLPATATVAAIAPSGASLPLSPSPDPLAAAASIIDSNAASILTFTSSTCSSTLTRPDFDAYTALFRQASAQGITVLASSTCAAGTGSFPASLPEVTAIVLPASPADPTFSGIAPRPDWQSAPGLPAGSFRLTPDLTVSSLSALSQTLASIATQSGTRLGNVDATLYSLAALPGLYTQPDTPATGTWEPATGLGQVDLAMLAKVYPRGSSPTNTSINSSVYGVIYSQPFTLTSTVTPSASGSSAVPTGTITFSAATQGTLGTVALIGGTASLPSPGNLPVGTYVLTAAYSGDANYAAGNSTAGAVLTITQAAASIAATLSPSSVPSGSSSTLSVTVTLPYTGAAPTGNVTATVNGIAGAVYTGTLAASATPGSASASISIPAPAMGTYTVQTTCAGTSNFQCPTPGTPTLTVTGAGNTSTALTLSPAVPLGGQPVTLTATISSAVTGTPTGTVTFLDNGVAIGSAPVSAKQAIAKVTLPPGTAQSLTAAYAGDATFNPSTSPAVVVSIASAPSTTILTSSSTSALSTASILLTAQVNPPPGSAIVPTGLLTFTDTVNGLTSTLGTAKLTASGSAAIAQLTTSALLPGTHQLSASYPGDANLIASASTLLTLNIADYTVTSNPSTLNLTRGQSATATLTIAPVSGFSGTVSFRCTAPTSTETSCSIQPQSLTGAGSVQLTLTSAAAASHAQPTSFASSRLFAGATLALLLAWPLRRRRLSALALALIALAFTANLGCGSGTSAALDPGTPVGTSLFSISTAGTDGVTSVTHDFQIPVAFQ